MRRTQISPRASKRSMIVFTTLLLLGGAARAQTVNVSVCGTVTAYAAPGLSPGLIVIGGQSFLIAVGATLNGSGIIDVGSNLCLQGSLNVLAELQTGTITANASASVSVCGTVTVYAAATALVPGSIRIGGQTFPIAAGTNINGSGLVHTGADLCLNATLNGLGQIVLPTTVTANATTAVSVCGVVSAYTAATATAPGSLTIGGNTFPIAAGTSLNGSGLITAGANVCLSGTLNASGQLVLPSTITANGSVTVNVCGIVSAYTAATASSKGSITLGGQTFPIATGTSVTGSGLITVGANLCLNGTLGASGQLIPPTSVTVNAGTSIDVCGVVTAYTAATSITSGSLTIGGQTLSITPGTTLTGAALIHVGANLCLTATVHGSQIGGGVVSPNPTPPPPTTSVNVCGIVTAFIPATASTPGSLTISGQTFSIAVGTFFGSEVRAGASLCFDLPITNGGGQISSSGGPVHSAPANGIVFPVVAHLTGAGGAEWRTDVRVVNLGTSPATVVFEWYPFSATGRSGPAETSTVVLNPGVQGTMDHVLESLFDTEGGGSLRLVSASFEIGAALRLYHVTDEGPCEGTFGTFEKGLKRSESVTRAALLVLGHQPLDVARVRTNLGYFNSSPDPVQITFRTYATDGRLLGSKSMTLPSFANEQRSIFDLVDTVPESDREQQDLYVTFEAQGGLPFVYGSAVYNSSNDGLFVLPWQY